MAPVENVCFEVKRHARIRTWCRQAARETEVSKLHSRCSLLRSSGRADVAQNGAAAGHHRNGMPPPSRPSSDDDEHLPRRSALARKATAKCSMPSARRNWLPIPRSCSSWRRIWMPKLATANPDSLTPDQLRRIAEIEKLAHSVKEKMSTSVRGTTMYPLDPPPRMR